MICLHSRTSAIFFKTAELETKEFVVFSVFEGNAFFDDCRFMFKYEIKNVATNFKRVKKLKSVAGNYDVRNSNARIDR